MQSDSLDRVSWPDNFKPTLLRDTKAFFEIDESLLLSLGVKAHIKQRGYKDLDVLVEGHGKSGF